MMTLADPGSWPPVSAESATETARYGTAAATAWDRMHPRLTHRGPWAGHPGRLPIVRAADLRRPWERPLAAGAADPSRVRGGFRYLRAKTTRPASAPKPGHPGPGRPPGSNNRHHAIRYDVGNTVTPDTTKTRNQQLRG
jgi:hypothetical protein